MAHRIPVYAIIRIKGRVDCPYDVEYTLKLLRLHKKYHCVLYPKTLPGLDGMLLKAKDWITWGEIDRETLIELLYKRGKIACNKPLTDEYVDTHLAKLGINGGIPALADAILEGRVMLHKLNNLIKPVFRLHPPRKGFKGSTKRPYDQGGELGYRGSAINELIKRML
ncbi:MAG: 50S ribosomal protein L30 [Desulfurococcaceae archaeon]